MIVGQKRLNATDQKGITQMNDEEAEVAIWDNDDLRQRLANLADGVRKARRAALDAIAAAHAHPDSQAGERLQAIADELADLARAAQRQADNPARPTLID